MFGNASGVIAGGLGLLMVASACMAGDATKNASGGDMSEGDPDYGEYLSTACLNCHSVDAANPAIPSLAGRPQADIVEALQAYKQKLRPNPVMQMMASRLSDAEIAALAAYFETLKQ